MYSIDDYGAMIADEARMNPYLEALRRSVKPGDAVVDLGSGTGIFALWACRFGARRVYAIEPTDAILIAREIAAANGYADRIEFIPKLSTEITLPEQADVVISDLRGLLPFLGRHISSIVDARTRLLKPDGALIPQRDDMWLAVVEAGDIYDEHFGHWDEHEFDMTAARRIVTNTTGWRIKKATPEILFAEPQLWATLDYLTISDPNVAGEMTFTAARDGTAHGLLVWFDATLADGLGFSNAPGVENPAKVYGKSFFPWSDPVELNAGDQIYVRLDARLVGPDYVYRWETTISSASEPQQIKTRFKQSTFYGAPLSLSGLRKQSEAYIPELNTEGLMDHYILSQMNNRTPLGAIAKQLAERFPDKFTRWQDALTRAGELAGKYSE
ncbi:MAG TPA: 50S ribosomal protein L11 methyltransferase [Blastocatellia bacterium]|nr:50S ribosomal protein L11 methyltransferase [Blastocatellia bacterium]